MAYGQFGLVGSLCPTPFHAFLPAGVVEFSGSKWLGCFDEQFGGGRIWENLQSGRGCWFKSSIGTGRFDDINARVTSDLGGMCAQHNQRVSAHVVWGSVVNEGVGGSASLNNPSDPICWCLDDLGFVPSWVANSPKPQGLATNDRMVFRETACTGNKWYGTKEEKEC